MYDRDYHKKVAKEYTGTESAYMSAAVKDGKNAQMVISGDFLSCLWLVSGFIKRISELTKTSFQDTWICVRALYETKGVDIEKKLNATYNYQQIAGGEEKYQEHLEEITENAERKANEKNVQLAAENKILKKEKEASESRAKSIQCECELKLRVKDIEIQRLNKEILKLEADIKRMEQQM